MPEPVCMSPIPSFAASRFAPTPRDHDWKNDVASDIGGPSSFSQCVLKTKSEIWWSLTASSMPGVWKQMSAAQTNSVLAHGTGSK